jgi:hypothetical protein
MKLNAIPIPKRFMLHGQVIEVKHDATLGAFQGNRGECRYGYNEIKLQPKVEGDPQPIGKIEHAFFHELYHLALEHAEREDLSKNEEHVNLVASLLHQAFSTAEYK